MASAGTATVCDLVIDTIPSERGGLPAMSCMPSLASIASRPYTSWWVTVARTTALIWEGHKSGREIGYCHIEKLHNLEKLPSKGFSISCFPVKIRAASAGWTRAIAILD